MIKSYLLSIVISSINHEIVSFQETPICVKPIWQFLDTSVYKQIQSYCTCCVQNLRLIPHRNFFHWCQTSLCVRSVARSRLIKNVRCKNGCAVSRIGKVGLLFVFMIVSNHCYANNSFWISFSLEQFILRAVNTQRPIEKGAHVKLMFTR